MIGLESEVNSPPKQSMSSGRLQRMFSLSKKSQVGVLECRFCVKLTVAVKLVYTCNLTTDYAYLNTESKRQKGKGETDRREQKLPEEGASASPEGPLT